MTETIFYFVAIAIMLSVSIVLLHKYIGRFDNIPEEVWNEYEEKDHEKSMYKL